MSPLGTRRPPQRVVKVYGLGSLLGAWSLLIAYLMAAGGMHGWRDSAIRDMEKDAVELEKRGYRVVSTDEYALPLFGMGYFKVVYELADPPG